jgi:hypothetical protein
MNDDFYHEIYAKIIFLVPACLPACPAAHRVTLFRFITFSITTLLRVLVARAMILLTGNSSFFLILIIFLYFFLIPAETSLPFGF